MRERSIDVRQKHQLAASPTHTPTRDQICNLGMCQDQESNPQPFGVGMTLQPTNPHQPGHHFLFVKKVRFDFTGP